MIFNYPEQMAAEVEESPEVAARWTGEGWQAEAGEGLPADDAGSVQPPPEAQARILALVEERPGVSQKELAAELGVTGAAVKYHIDDLIASGKLRRERKGMRVAYYREDYQR